MGDNGLLGNLVAFCREFASMLHIILIIFSMLLAYPRASDYISDPKLPLPVKTMQVTTSQVYLHRLWAIDLESLIPVSTLQKVAHVRCSSR